jgi:hypothetical protein
VYKLRSCHPRACLPADRLDPGIQNPLENNGFPIKDFGNDEQGKRVYTQTLRNNPMDFQVKPWK